MITFNILKIESTIDELNHNMNVNTLWTVYLKQQIINLNIDRNFSSLWHL